MNPPGKCLIVTACLILSSNLLIPGCSNQSTSTGSAKQKFKMPEKTLAALEQAEKFELLSLYPYPPEKKSPTDFHGWKVLGRTQIKDKQTREQLIAAFKRSVEENDGYAAACFDPRHGIRVQYQGKTVDWVICCECAQVREYMDDDMQSGFLTSGSVKTVFNKVLREAGVELPTK